MRSGGERPPERLYRWLRRRLPSGSSGETILGDLQEEYAAFRPRWARNAWYALVAVRTAAEYTLIPAARRARALQPRGPAAAGAAQDLRHALRSLSRHPGYTIVAVLTMGLGIGATTAVFSIVNGALLRPLPYHEPQQLLRLGADFGNGGLGSMSVPNVRDLRDGARSIEDLRTYQHWWFNLSAGPGTTEGTAVPPARVSGLRVEPGFLELLGVRPEVGRSFVPEDAYATAQVVILADRLWRSRFGGDPNLVGGTVYLDLVPRTVVGILPPGFAYLQDPQVLIPLPAGGTRFDDRRARQVDALARVAREVTLDAAMEELRALYAELERRYPEANEGMSVAGLPVHEWRVRNARKQLWLFAGAVALVLAVACANVANLSLVRAALRRVELGVRAALGAGRGRLVRLLLVENLLLAIVGAGVAAAAAPSIVRILVTAYAASIPRAEEVTVDAGVLLFTIALGALSGMVVGMAPALQVHRGDVAGAIGASGRTVTSGRRLREALIVVEVALAVVLVAGAGLLLGTVARLRAVDLGVREEGVLTFAVGLPAARYTSPAEIDRFWDEMVQTLAGIPGVEAVGLTTRTPLNGGTNGGMFLLGGNQREPSVVEARAVNSDYLRALGMELRAGRMLTVADRQPGGGIVVNEAFARTMTDDGEVLGEVLAMVASEGRFPIVGVVSDVRDFGPTADPRPTAYWHVGSSPFGASAYLTAAVRTGTEPMSLLGPVRERMLALDPDVPLVDIATLEELAVDRLGSNRRSALSLLGSFALIATALGAIGIYGVMSFGVAQRTREIGVRAALGASPHAVRRLVVVNGLRLAAIGITCGTLLSLASGRLLAGLLYEISPANPGTIAAVAVIMLLTALVASWLPARRAARIEVVDALRHD